jgi:hypothetical protein
MKFVEPRHFANPDISARRDCHQTLNWLMAHLPDMISTTQAMCLVTNRSERRSFCGVA